MARKGFERHSSQIGGRVRPDLDVQAWPDSRQGIAAVTVDKGHGMYAGPTTLIGLPPWQAPPLGSASFYVSTFATVGPGPLTAEFAGSVFQVPVGNVAIIRSLTLNVNNIVAASRISFALLFNGSPVQGYDQMAVFPRVAASVSVSFTADDTFIHVPDTARISVQVTITDANSYLVGCDFKGWYYAKRFDGLGMVK